MSEGLILLTDIGEIWIEKDDEMHLKLSDNFFKSHGISLKIVEKVDREVFPRLKNEGRRGKMNYREIIERYFKALGCKNYKKLASEYIAFEIRNLRKFYKPCRHAKQVLSVLKRNSIRIVGLTDTVHSVKEVKRRLRILKMEKYFDEIYTANSLRAEKPEAFKFFKGRPLIFLGHDDDELLGAKKYNFLTIGLNNRNSDFFISSITELPELLKGLKERRV